MDTSLDFEDMLRLLVKHRVRYLIVGGLAVILHSKPRYTKDMDIWVEPSPGNIARANRALAEFASPFFFDAKQPDQVVQIGVAPNRIDLLARIEGVRFGTAWKKRVRHAYGDARANWIDLDSLLRNKRRLQGPRHQEDVRLLEQVKRKQTRGPQA